MEIPQARPETSHNPDIQSMIRVLAVAPSLGGGGAEKHLIRVLNGLDPKRFSVTAAIARSGGAFENEIAPHIDVLSFGGKYSSSAASMLSGVPRLRKLIHQFTPDVVWSVLPLTNIAALIAAGSRRNRRFAVVLSEQASLNLECAARTRGASGNILLLSRKVFYPRSDAVVALSNGVASELETYIPSLRPKVTVIHNACVDGQTQERASAPPDDPTFINDGVPTILACGRLVWQKDYQTLLQAFSLLISRLPARLLIIGDGPEYSMIRRQLEEMEIKDSVYLAGFKSNPYAYMARCRLFAISSVSEGFGNVIVEAMAAGAPVVATDCPHGPRDIIAHEENGLLVPPRDPVALAHAMERLLTDESLRLRVLAHAQATASRFSTHAIADQYGKLFESLVQKTFSGVSYQ